MGAKVVIADVSDERGQALARAVGAGSLYVPTDCKDEDAIATAVKTAAGLGPLRAAVHTSPRHAATFASDNPCWPLGRTHAYGALME
jgi:NAD(P)-dependent dehydrogenase (short-subunit alcohol dehydrogenase family)